MKYTAQSKYAGVASRHVTTPEGRRVQIAEAPVPEVTQTYGWHLWRQGQRLDLLAERHLNGAPEWWRLVDHANQMLPDAANGQAELPVPTKPRDR